MRKVLIDEIKARTVKAGGDWAKVVDEMEGKRVAAKASLDKGIKALKAGKKEADCCI
jgi:hypothetical protein